MSRLADLINELCPDGVEYKPLKELLRIRNGRDYKLLSSGTVPVYGSGGVMTHVSEAIGFGPTVLIPRKGSLDNVFFVEGPFWTVDTIFYTEIGPEVEPKYLYYNLKRMRLSQMNEAAGVPSMNQKKLGQIRIPVPPLEVQREIVKILDQFTTLEAELEAELEVRRAQYEYYRNQLLSYDALVSRCPNGVQYKSIGSFSKCVAGATPNSKNPSLWDGDIPWMSSGEVNKKTVYSTNRFITQLGFDSCSTKMVPAGAVVIALAGQGKTRGTVARIRIELCTNQSLCAIITDKTVDSDYLFHYLSGQYDNLRAVSSGDGTRGGLNLKMIRAYKVPVPPIEEQRRIADVLDRFDTLVNDISSGLPAEIAARRAQYEYYRDRLLSFPEKK